MRRYNCYSNTDQLESADNTILMSFPDRTPSPQIDRQTGAVVATYGDAAGSYTFSPSTWPFEFQHFPNITAAGRCSSRHTCPPSLTGARGGANQHAFVEFDIDRAGKRLVEKWNYAGA